MIGAALEMLLRGSNYELLGRARSAAEANREVTRQKPTSSCSTSTCPTVPGSTFSAASRAHVRGRA
jgi:hypothetical protein